MPSHDRCQLPGWSLAITLERLWTAYSAPHLFSRPSSSELTPQLQFGHLCATQGVSRVNREGIIVSALHRSVCAVPRECWWGGISIAHQKIAWELPRQKSRAGNQVAQLCRTPSFEPFENWSTGASRDHFRSGGLEAAAKGQTLSPDCPRDFLRSKAKASERRSWNLSRSVSASSAKWQQRN